LKPAAALAAALAVPAVLVLCAGGAAGREVTHENVTIRVEESPISRAPSLFFMPARFTVTNRGEERSLALTIRGRGYGYRSDFSCVSSVRMKLPPGETSLEIPHLRSSYYSVVEVHLDGERVEDRLGGISSHHGYGSVAVLRVGLKPPPAKPTSSPGPRRRYAYHRATAVDLTPDQLPRHWQCYLGMRGVLLLDTGKALELGPAQKRAINTWVTCGGGALVLSGDGGTGAARSLGLTLGEPVGGYRRCLTGVVRLATEKEALAYTYSKAQSMSNRGVQPRKLGLLHGGNTTSSSVRPAADGESDIFAGLHEIPRLGYALLSILLAAIIGPANLVFLRRKRKAALIYLTAPLLALLGMASLGLYALLRDGLEVKSNEIAVLLHDQRSGRGAAIQSRALFAGMAPGDGAVYDTEVAALPFTRRSAAGVTVSTDWSDSQHLAGGWVRGRELCGVSTVAPVRVRMGVRVKRLSDGNVEVVNELSSAVKRAWARLPDGSCWRSDRVEPGGRARMLRARSEPRFGDGNFRSALHRLGWRVLAEAEGLPYLQTGGLKARKLKARYLYVGVNN
jgi:hypothetical protein